MSKKFSPNWLVTRRGAKYEQMDVTGELLGHFALCESLHHHGSYVLVHRMTGLEITPFIVCQKWKPDKFRQLATTLNESGLDWKFGVFTSNSDHAAFVLNSINGLDNVA